MKLSPFQRLLGADFERLPAPVRELHNLTESAVATGCAETAVAAGPAATFLRWFAGLPRPGRDVPVSVAFRPDGRGGERWERRFASRRYASTMLAETGGSEGLLLERFGLFHLYFRLTPGEDWLVWPLVRWRFLGAPLPPRTAPSIGERGRSALRVRYRCAFPDYRSRHALSQLDRTGARGATLVATLDCGYLYLRLQKTAFFSKQTQ